MSDLRILPSRFVPVKVGGEFVPVLAGDVFDAAAEAMEDIAERCILAGIPEFPRTAAADIVKILHMLARASREADKARERLGL